MASADSVMSADGAFYRPNIRISAAADLMRAESDFPEFDEAPDFRGALAGRRDSIRVVDLFAGAGGLSTGFVATRSRDARYKIIYAAERNRVYNRSLNANHSYIANVLGDPESKPFEPTNLTSAKGRADVADAVRRARGVDLLIGGPPCQGFSQSNRNSWSPDNPNNQLVEVFVRFAAEHQPKVVLMENVQGIMWTPRKSVAKARGTGKPVVEYIARRLRRAGYLLFSTVLDAAWYGVPQHRNRFFLVAIRADLGYDEDSFGEWGPFPTPTHGPGLLPFVTVKDAISDLPRVRNGESRYEQRYSPRPGGTGENAFLRSVRRYAPRTVIEGHVVTDQAPYVIERYREVPPGGNWQSIRRMMKNYSSIENTHSNIYRRLTWNAPAVTIGHYRKSMLIHPSQSRGLSLREASRLQSLPDWFRFHGSENEHAPESLSQKQQQLANAVSYAMTKSFANFLLNL
jgi:DNA (cytosine-5)-methyltransferase 1